MNCEMLFFLLKAFAKMVIEIKGIKMKSVIKFFGLVIFTGILFPVATHAEGDVASGQAEFNKKCKLCHTFEKGGDAKIGPNLYGIYDSKAGQFEGYKYSKSLLEANLTWDDATLNAYLEKPKDVIPKGKMVFAGFKKEQDREDVIAYLKTLKD